MRVKIRHLSVVIIAVILYSILITSFHHHADLADHPDCAICKFSQDLSSGDQAAQCAIVTPSFAYSALCADSFISFPGEPAIETVTRAPPVYIPS